MSVSDHEWEALKAERDELADGVEKIRAACQGVVDEYLRLYNGRTGIWTGLDAGWGQGFGERSLAERVLSLLPKVS